MNIYKRLTLDHERQRALCRRLVDIKADGPDRRAFWSELKAEIEAHAVAEEQAFYAPLMAQPEATERIRRSVIEHYEIASAARELDDADISSPGWQALMRRLAREIEQHLDEVENEIIPLAKALFNRREAEEMATRFNAAKPLDTHKDHAA